LTDSTPARQSRFSLYPSPDAAMICGQTLIVDGGYSLGA